MPLTIYTIAARTYAAMCEGPLPAPDVLVALPWVAAVVRFVCGPQPEPAYVPGWERRSPNAVEGAVHG